MTTVALDVQRNLIIMSTIDFPMRPGNDVSLAPPFNFATSLLSLV